MKLNYKSRKTLDFLNNKLKNLRSIRRERGSYRNERSILVTKYHINLCKEVQQWKI